MQRIFVFIIFTLLLQNAIGQNASRLAYSDSLYARGVALYNAKEYDAAILLFEQSKAIETEELDSLDSRVTYLRNWIASCYFNKGDLKNAALYDERGYDLPPIDRRLMVKSDSISKVVLAYKGDDTNFIIQKLQEMYQIEYAALGRESRWTINTRMYIAELTAYSGDFQKAKADVKRVLDDCDNLYGKNARFKRFLLEQAINVYSMKGELYSRGAAVSEFHPRTARVMGTYIHRISHLSSRPHRKRHHVLIEHKPCDSCAVIGAQVIPEPCRLFRHSF